MKSKLSESAIPKSFISKSTPAAALLLMAGLVCFGSAAQNLNSQNLNSQNLASQNSGVPTRAYGSDKPLTEPALLGEGVISTADYESHPQFTVDGKALYFLKNSPSFNFWTIVVSRFEAGRWSAPEVAPFSGQYSDADPFISPDGSKFYFISNRPAPGKTSRDLDIWVMDKTADGWGAPRNLGAPVNSDRNEWFPTVTTDGTLYFGSGREGGKGRHDLYRARLAGGKYLEPENLGDAINTASDEYEPLIAPDESYIIFMSSGRRDSLGSADLYISHRRGGVWTKAANLGDKINSSGFEVGPKISPDGKYFLWTSTRGFGSAAQEKPLNYRELMNKLHSPRNGLGDIYQIDISALNIERPDITR